MSTDKKFVKAFYNFLLILSTLSSITAYGMPRSSQRNNETVKAYFAPDEIKKELISLLNRASRKVLIAMYQITDDDIINEISALTRRGVEVQIIVDESSPNLDNLISRFLQNKIIPIIYPSETMQLGIMHNKFLIIDDAEVWTGSANFTRPALAAAQRINFENVVIINSREIAKEYTEEFGVLENIIMSNIIDLLSEESANALPARIVQIGEVLYQSNHKFRLVIQDALKELSEQQKWQLAQNIPLALPEKRSWRDEPATEAQLRHIRRLKGFVQKRNLTKGEASNLIDDLKEQQERQFKSFSQSRQYR